MRTHLESALERADQMLPQEINRMPPKQQIVPRAEMISMLTNRATWSNDDQFNFLVRRRLRCRNLILLSRWMMVIAELARAPVTVTEAELEEADAREGPDP